MMLLPFLSYFLAIFLPTSRKNLDLRTRTLNAEIRWQDDVTRLERMRSLQASQCRFCQ